MKRAATGILLLPLVLLGSGCSTLNTNVDYDGSVNFSKYRTFSLKEGTPAKDPLTQQRIEDAIVASLQSKGLRRVPDGGELLVYTHVRTQNQQQIEWNNYGYAGWGWGWGWGWRGWGGPGWSTATVRNVPIGTLIVDLVDPTEKRLVWRGIATEYVDKILAMSPEEKTKAAHEAMGKLFKDYPPKTS
jgi:uncharacterized protein DUF4136